ncbi:UNVERIFIED_CONTAM: hypothetical protein GTU68_024146, partial [Idotea baltica]|nr:hypothetical protein [Idotea baltica]
MAEILVRLSDESGGALEGVLVSTSGGKNYRQNSLTEADGTFAFQSLMPGDYFLRPMMKEYTFEPPSKMVQVEGGATVHVQISGVRVAYSILGQTISLSGEPEGDVMVEAIGTGEKCLGLQEEALSDAHGAFRIRGLAPNCDYTLQLKKGTGVNEHVDRSLPATRSVRIESDDFRGIKVVVLRPFLQMDVTVYVTTDRRYLPSLS